MTLLLSHYKIKRNADKIKLKCFLLLVIFHFFLVNIATFTEMEAAILNYVVIRKHHNLTRKTILHLQYKHMHVQHTRNGAKKLSNEILSRCWKAFLLIPELN